MKHFQTVRNHLQRQLLDLCATFESLEKDKQFVADPWRSALGRGRTHVVQEGEVWEKGGIGFSQIAGAKLPPAASETKPHLIASPFRACGISVVMHPQNPYAPASHFNVRFFATEREWWFGGGFDLTPYYPNRTDCRFWHEQARAVCARLGKGIYERYKARCDEYFYLPHRAETRGIGGLFFDDLNQPDFATCFAFIGQLGRCYRDAYLHLVTKNKDRPYDEKQRAFLVYRRGRYAEFNLLYDRGTRFGLQAGGRIESILMSLPPVARWPYHPPASADDARLRSFLKPRAWCTPDK